MLSKVELYHYNYYYYYYNKISLEQQLFDYGYQDSINIETADFAIHQKNDGVKRKRGGGDIIEGRRGEES